MDPTKSLSISTEENYTMPQIPAHIANVTEDMASKINSESTQDTKAQEHSESNTHELPTETKESEVLSTNNSPTTPPHDINSSHFPNNMHPYMQFFPHPLCYPFQFPPYNANGLNNSNNVDVAPHEHPQPNPSAMQVPRTDENTRSVPNNQHNLSSPVPPPYAQNSMYYQPLPVIFCSGHHLNHPNSQDLKLNCSETISNFKIPQEITSFIDNLGRNWTCLDSDKGNKEKGKILTRKTGKIPTTPAKKATTTKSESRRIVTPSEESPRNIKEDGSARRQVTVKSPKSSLNDLGIKKRPCSKSKKTINKPVESDSADSCVAEYGSLMSLPKSSNRTKESNEVPVSSTSVKNRTRSLSWGSELNILAKNVKRALSELITNRNNYDDVSDGDVDDNQPASNPSLTKAYYRPNLTRMIQNSLNRLEARGGTSNRSGVVIPAENLHPRSSNAPEPIVRLSKRKGNSKKSRRSSRTRDLFKEETDNDSTSSSSSDSDFNIFKRKKNSKSKRKDDSNRQRRSDNSDWDQPKPHSILKNLKKIQSAGLISIANRSRSPRSGNECKKAIKDEPRTQKTRTSWGSDVATEEANRFCQCQTCQTCQNTPTYQAPQWSMNDSPDPTTSHQHTDIAPRQSTSHSPIQNTSNSLVLEDYRHLNNDSFLNTLNNANLFHRTAFNGRLSNADRPLEENRYRNNILRRAAFNVENLPDFRVPNNDRLARLESQLFRFSGRGTEVNNFENNLQVSVNGAARRVRLCPTPRNQNNFDLLTPHLEQNHDLDRRLDDNSRTMRSIRRPSMLRPRTPRNGGHTSSEETARQNWMELERVTYRRPRSANTVRKNPVTKRNPKLEEEFHRIQNSDYMMKLNENLIKEDDSRENTEVGEGREFQENDENNRECECEEDQEEQSKSQQPEQDYEDDF